GDADPSLTYQVSGLKNGDTAGAVLNGGGLVRVSGENVGNYAIQQGGLGLVSGNYDLAYQGNNLTITKALLNVIADAKTKVYGDADPSLTYQVSGLKNGDSAGSILTGGLNRAAGENVGVYGINQGDLALNSGNYDLSYQGNNLTITKALLNVIADAKTKVYGDADPSLTYQVSGLKNGDTAGAVLNGGSLSRVAGENVGVYGINQGGLALNSGNYDLSYQGNNLTITKALLNVIADAKTKVYGDADPSLTYQVSGLKNGDTAGAVLNGGSLSRVAGENVGVYGINQGGLALNSGNYDLSYQGNNLTITKALLNVIADAKTKVYGDADPSLTYQVSGLKNGDTAGAVLNGGGLVRVSGENVGNYAIQQGGLGLVSGNYDLAYQGNNLTITKALLNVFADAKSKQVGTADPALTYQVSGLKNGDSAGQVLAGGLGRVGGEAVGQYDILQGGLALTSGNYQLNYQGNLLSILPLPVTPGDLGQLAALSDLRELQKGRDPDTPGDAVYRTTTLENPFLENPFLRAYALGMDVSDPNLLPATAAGPAEDASAKRVGQFTDRPLRAEAESGAGCSNQSYLADYWSCFNKPLNF
ncbi:MBG domain-containing protein, partial [Pseudomonas aeruginosa]|uniref:MBG domain-containing protein n=1 Tax=Pseudomonas aeruginosa TaxID=287 RepID=UPI0027E4F154